MTSLPIYHRVAKAVWALSLLGLPALLAVPTNAGATVPRFQGASTPVADLRHARVIVKYKAEGALMRESTLSARDPDRDGPAAHRCRAPPPRSRASPAPCPRPPRH